VEALTDELIRLSWAHIQEVEELGGMSKAIETGLPKMRIEDGRAIPAFMSQALHNQPVTVFGDGSQTRSVCYVDDLVEGIYRLLLSDENMPVNIGNPDEISMLDLAKEIIDITGSKSDIIFKELPEDDPKIRQPDITIARTRLQWEPRIQRREGLIKTMEYFKKRLGL
jgi:dTDP-glucose 4,6-dehydratase